MTQQQHRIEESVLRALIEASNVGSISNLREQIARGEATRIGEGVGEMDAASAIALYRLRAGRVETAGVPNTMQTAIESLSLLEPSAPLSVVAYRSETTFFVVFADETPSIVACFQIDSPRRKRPA